MMNPILSDIEFDVVINVVGPILRSECQIDGSGALTMNTPNGLDAIDLDQTKDFSALPSQNTSDSTTTTTTGSPDATISGLSTGSARKSHQAEIVIENPESTAQDFNVTVTATDLSTHENITVTGLAAGATRTVFLNFNPGDSSSVEVESSNVSSNQNSAQINEVTIYYWDHFFELNSRGMRLAMGNDAFFEVADRLTRIGGGIEVDEEGRVFAENGNLKWLDYSTGDTTTLN